MKAHKLFTVLGLLLIGLQLIALFGNRTGSQLWDRPDFLSAGTLAYDLGSLFGYFLCAILGIVFLLIAYALKRKHSR